MGKEFKIGFDLYVFKYISDEYRNVLHFTQGGNYGTYGDRIPGVWIFRDKMVYISHALSGNFNYMAKFPALREKTWHHFKITQMFSNNKAGRYF